MAVRPAWIIRDNKVEVEWFDFKWYSGFALSQVQRSVESLHNAIKSHHPCVLESRISPSLPFKFLSNYKHNSDISIE